MKRAHLVCDAIRGAIEAASCSLLRIPRNLDGEKATRGVGEGGRGGRGGLRPHGGGRRKKRALPGKQQLV